MNTYIAEQEALSKLLKCEESDITLWSDGSMTIGNNDQVEYYALEEETDSYIKLIGEKDGYFIYQN